MTNITTRNNKIQTTDNKIQARDKSFKPFGVYRNSVLSLNSTQIASDVNTRLLYKWLIDNNLYDDLVFAVGGEYGIQKTYVNTNWQIQNAYDLSKYENNANQDTPADQPIISGNRWVFDGVNSKLKTPDLTTNINNNDWTMGVWCNITAENSSLDNIIGLGRQYVHGCHVIGGAVRIRDYIEGSFTDIAEGFPAIINTWHLLTARHDSVAKEINIYQNTSLVQTMNYSGLLYSDTAAGDYYINMGYRGISTQHFHGIGGEYFILTSEISIAQLESFYNFTKGKYGH